MSASDHLHVGQFGIRMDGWAPGTNWSTPDRRMVRRVREVPLDADLRSGQSHVIRAEVDRYVARRGRGAVRSPDTRSPRPEVVDRGDMGLWIADGHHRIVAAKMRGDASLPMAVWGWRNR